MIFALLLNFFFYYSCIAFLLFSKCCDGVISEKIYDTISSKDYVMCVKRFNATNQIGCSSSRYGNVGVLLEVEDDKDLEFLAKTTHDLKFILLMELNLLNRKTFELLKSSKRVEGIVINKPNKTIIEKLNNSSPDLEFPNLNYGLYNEAQSKAFPWNEGGNGLMFEDIPFPIAVMVNTERYEYIKKKCYTKYNTQLKTSGDIQYPLCSMRLKAFMHGAVNSVTCVRRSNLYGVSYCEPIGDVNILASLNFLNTTKTISENSTIVISARMDSFSLFDGLSPGVSIPTTGFIVLHAVAQALKSVQEELQKTAEKFPIFFMLFQGEAFDYIGSTKMVYSLKNGEIANLNLNSIGTFIELGRFGLPTANSVDGQDPGVYIVRDKVFNQDSSEAKTKIDDMINDLIGLKPHAIDISKLDTDNLNLPPSSLQAFLKHKRDIAGVVLTSNTNGFYNSFLDTSENIGLDYSLMANSTEESKYNWNSTVSQMLTNVATSVARLVYKLASGKQISDETIKNVEADSKLVSNLLYCFIENSECELFNATNQKYESLIPREEMKSYYKNRFAGIYSEYGFYPSQQPHRHHQYLLAYHLGEMVNLTEEECVKKITENKEGLLYYYLDGKVVDEATKERQGECFKSTVSIHPTISPAFKDQEWEKFPEFPAWTESRWNNDAFNMEIFLIPSTYQEMVTLVAGIATILLSGLVLLLIWKQKITFAVSSGEEDEGEGKKGGGRKVTK